ncbi:MAG: hypothetical protein ACI4IA_03200 [Acutalibacteraceae bacterium]
MSLYEDDDIKIFTSEKNLNHSADVDADVLQTVEAMNHDRQNGNVNKARVIGKHLAKLFVDEVEHRADREELFQDSSVMQQISVLFLFSAETGFNIYLPSTTLSTIAITAMHDQLELRQSKLYRDVYESSAYSFYFLNIRKESSNVPENIGKTFAMLCHHEDDIHFIQEGAQVYNVVLAEIERDVEKANFAE